MKIKTFTSTSEIGIDKLVNDFEALNDVKATQTDAILLEVRNGVPILLHKATVFYTEKKQWEYT